MAPLSSVLPTGWAANNLPYPFCGGGLVGAAIAGCSPGDVRAMIVVCVYGGGSGGTKWGDVVALPLHENLARIE